METWHIGIIVLAAVALPNWMSLSTVAPILMILAHNGTIDPLASFGEADVHYFDLVLAITAVKAGVALAVHRSHVGLDRVYVAILVYIGVMAAATALASYRFEWDIVRAEGIALARLVTQISVLPSVIWSLRTWRQAVWCGKVLEYVGWAIAATVYLNVLLVTFDMTIGEVQITEAGVRYFGPLGDQIGLILLLFVYYAWLQGRWILTALLTGALFATGTRGAVIALGVGSVVVLWRLRKSLLLVGRRTMLVGVSVAVVSTILILQDVGSIRTRFIGPAFMSGFEQRISTMNIATQVFFDYLLSGIGYTGFRFLAVEYGAFEAFDEGFAPNFIATASNQYLQAATDGGIAGLIAYLWMVMVIVKRLNSAEKWSQAGYLWLLSLLIGSQWAVWLLPGSLVSYLLWVTVGLVMTQPAAAQRTRDHWRWARDARATPDDSLQWRAT